MTNDHIGEGDGISLDQFDDWVPENQLSLEIGEAIARRLVPETLYKSIKYPSKVGILVCANDPNNLKFLVYYERPKDDPGVDQDRRAFRDYSRRITLGQKIGHARLDPFLQEHYDLVKEGKLEINKQILLQVELLSEEDFLLVLLYRDKEELRGKGIARDFFKQLFAVARRLGFTIVASQNNPGNHGFFISKLNGTTLTDINDEGLSKRIKGLLPDEIIDADTFTVNKLN